MEIVRNKKPAPPPPPPEVTFIITLTQFEAAVIKAILGNVTMDGGNWGPVADVIGDFCSGVRVSNNLYDYDEVYRIAGFRGPLVRLTKNKE